MSNHSVREMMEEAERDGRAIHAQPYSAEERAAIIQPPRSHAVPFGVEQAESRMRRPLLTLAIHHMAERLEIALAAARTIEEKAALGVEFTPADYNRLAEACGMADALSAKLAAALHCVCVVGGKLAALDARILAEREADEARVVGEVATPCRHERLSAITSAGTCGLDDCATHWGWCPDCDDYLVVTEYRSSDYIESRPMTEAERERFGEAEDRRRRGEWLVDAQAGAR